MDFWLLAGLIAIVVVPVMLAMWGFQKQSLGTIRCKRCHHAGPAKGLWLPFRGIKPVCGQCHGDDWVKAP